MKRLRSAMIGLGLCIAAVAARSPAAPPAKPAVSLRPAGLEQFFVDPGKAAVLRFAVERGEVGDALSARLLDYAGKPTGTAVDVRREGANVVAAVTPEQGFWEIEFRPTGQRFGLTALASAAKPVDPFFAIDGALSWLVRDDAQREGLVRTAARLGIGTVRERLTWGAVHPAKDRRDWSGGVRFDRLRQAYAASGVKVLEMAHDAPAWMGRVKVYPENLAAAADSWAAIARHWQSTWDSVEVWNEPDIFFGGDLPADQYVPLVKAVAWRLRSAGVRVPVVGGALAHCNREYMDNAAQCGLLDAVDVFSFHTYDTAPAMEGLVARYRDWLATHQRPGVPLWITECGRPWKVGPERPPADQDAASALDIVMKAVEAKAAGVARHFPFVYPYYEENDNNFGMMDRRGSPLRAIAGYAQMARALAHLPFVGDLPCDKTGLKRARVFGDASRCVAVLYSGKPATVSVRLDAKVLRVESLTGRTIAVGGDGAIPVEDGMVYAWLDPANPGPIRKAKPAAPATHSPKPLSPIVLCYAYDAAEVAPFAAGYRMNKSPAGKLTLRIRAFNLSDQPRKAQLAVDAPSGVARPADRFVQLPPGGRADATWDLDLSAALAANPRADIAVTATTPGPKPGPGPRVLDRTVLRMHAKAGR